MQCNIFLFRSVTRRRLGALLTMSDINHLFSVKHNCSSMMNIQQEIQITIWQVKT